ncbi:MAG: hypothetical protein IJY31_06275 [Muribaculaceae bacterium]|nr:hypothetical protein [Muribaculaceae bacterium]
MAGTKIAGVMRAGTYSPNHIGNDAAILNVVAEQLRKRGCEVKIYSEEQLIAGKIEEKIIINMCRDLQSITLLQQLEDEGRLVINSGYGIENCIRERMTRILVGNDIPYPESLCVNTDEVVKDLLDKNGFTQCWIKRGDCHTTHKEDVTYVRHAQEAQEILQEYFLRGIKRAVISKHLPGKLIKFYGVQGSPFFYCLQPSGNGSDKANSVPVFDEKAMRSICQTAAEVLDVKIYGGDCIITTDGSIHIIAFDDWPSFAPCRHEAASHIAKGIIAEIKRHRKQT